MDSGVHVAALRALCDWKSAGAAPLLLELAKNSSNQTDRVLSLRGYLGMALKRDAGTGARLEICKEASYLVKSDDEKKLLLGVLGDVRSVETLGLVMPYLDDAAVKREAASTVVSIVEHSAGKQGGLVTEALLKAAAAADDPAMAGRAKALMGTPGKR